MLIEQWSMNSVSIYSGCKNDYAHDLNENVMYTLVNIFRNVN